MTVILESFWCFLRLWLKPFWEGAKKTLCRKNLVIRWLGDKICCDIIMFWGTRKNIAFICHILYLLSAAFSWGTASLPRDFPASAQHNRLKVPGSSVPEPKTLNFSRGDILPYDIHRFSLSESSEHRQTVKLHLNILKHWNVLTSFRRGRSVKDHFVHSFRSEIQEREGIQNQKTHLSIHRTIPAIWFISAKLFTLRILSMWNVIVWMQSCFLPWNERILERFLRKLLNKIIIIKINQQINLFKKKDLK